MKKKTFFINPKLKLLTSYLNSKFSILHPLTPLFFFYFLSLLLFFFFRSVFFCMHFDRLNIISNHINIFQIGFRIDTMLLCRILLPVFLFKIFLPFKLHTGSKFNFFISFYLALCFSIFLFLEIATFPFINEFDSRPDRLFLEHIVQIKEVFEMVLKGFTLSLIIGVISLCGSFLLFFTFLYYFLNLKDSITFKKRIALLCVAGTLLHFGYKGTFFHHSATIDAANFSTSHIANQLALNSTYSLLNAFYVYKLHEVDPKKLYGDMDIKEIISRVRHNENMDDSEFTSGQIPLLHYQTSNFKTDKPKNLVIIIEESLGAEFTGCLNGLPLTPNLDQLSKEGILFTNLYSTGNRTARALEAIISGFLPTPGYSAVKLGLAQKNFFTIAELLRRKGFSTFFIYGGSQNFDGMSSFLIGNGVEKIYDNSCYDKAAFKGTWGVSDEDLFNKANEIFRQQNKKPFFALILTVSNHEPYEFPDGKIELFDTPKATRNNAVKYADYALGKFFNNAKNEDYFNNTTFFISGDHSTRFHGTGLIPVKKYNVFAMIIDKQLKPGKYERIASQIDILPTLLDVIGIDAYHPVPAKSLFSLGNDIPGRAFIQFDETYGFLKGDQIMILQPQKKPAQFHYVSGKLIPAAAEPLFAETARAYALLPGYLYYNQLHRLPQKE